MSQNIINTAKSVRQIALHLVQSIPEELYDIQPKQFNNTIRWNVGHTVFCVNHFLSIGFPFHPNLPESFKVLFNTGTSPNNWTVTPPSKQELIQYLSDQHDNLSGISSSMLEQHLKSPIQVGPLQFNTIGELCNFAFIHEAMHIGTISSLLKVIQYQQLK